jgi:hypothetical protein
MDEDNNMEKCCVNSFITREIQNFRSQTIKEKLFKSFYNFTNYLSKTQLLIDLASVKKYLGNMNKLIKFLL